MGIDVTMQTWCKLKVGGARGMESQQKLHACAQTSRFRLTKANTFNLTQPLEVNASVIEENKHMLANRTMHNCLS